MIFRPFICLNGYTRTPTGHSTIAAAENARNPTVGPTTLHLQGLLLVPHSTHIGTPKIGILSYAISLLLSLRQMVEQLVCKQPSKQKISEQVYVSWRHKGFVYEDDDANEFSDDCQIPS